MKIVSILTSSPPPKEQLELRSRLATGKATLGSVVVLGKVLAAAALSLFHEDAELAWLPVTASQLRLAFDAMAVLHSLWAMELIPERGWQL